VRLVNDHQGEYSSLTAAAAVVAKQLGVGKESVRRWVIQSQVDGGQRAGATSEELAEIKALKAKNRRLREDVEILRGATTFFVVNAIVRGAPGRSSLLSSLPRFCWWLVVRCAALARCLRVHRASGLIGACCAFSTC
jgi:transposase-like protein